MSPLPGTPWLSSSYTGYWTPAFERVEELAVAFDYRMKKYIDYDTHLAYDSNIPLMRGVSGDDPDGGAGCGVDRGS